MGTALEANHMVAPVCLLARSCTSRTRRRVSFEVLQRLFILLSELSSVCFRRATFEFAMPTLVTSTAECERAILAYGK